MADKLLKLTKRGVLSMITERNRDAWDEYEALKNKDYKDSVDPFKELKERQYLWGKINATRMLYFDIKYGMEDDEES